MSTQRMKKMITVMGCALLLAGVGCMGNASGDSVSGEGSALKGGIPAHGNKGARPDAGVDDDDQGTDEATAGSGDVDGDADEGTDETADSDSDADEDTSVDEGAKADGGTADEDEASDESADGDEA